MAFLGSCYLFENTLSLAWHAAWNECAKTNAQLVAIESDIESSFITAELGRLDHGNKRFYTAGNDLDVENEWVWAGTNENSTNFTNGQIIEFSKWYDSQPNSFEENENCMIIYPEFDFTWHDFPCSYEYPFVCEKKNE